MPNNPVPTDLEPVDPYRCLLYDAGFGLSDESDPDPSNRDLGKVLRHYYEEDDAQQVEKELDRLFRAYRTEMKIGRTHYSPSPTWRDEYLLDYVLESPTRFAVRVHLFEKTGAHAGSQKSVGKYLGFVALRPPDMQRAEQPQDGVDEGYHHVIEAEITTPAHMLRPRYHLITTNASSARLGVMPFRSAVFMAPRFDDGQRKSTCVHLVLSQALHLVMGRFGCKPVSQREFDWQLMKLGDPLSAQHGVRMDQALAVLETQCDSGGYIASFVLGQGRDELRVKMDALRCLTDTLANGLPVMMMVSQDLLPVHPSISAPTSTPILSAGAEAAAEQDDESSAPVSHATLILGMHLLHSRHEIPNHSPWPNPSGGFTREDHAELPGRLVGHDVLQGPFSEWTAEALLDSAFRIQAKHGGKPTQGVHFLAVGPRGLRLGLDRAAEATRAFVATHLRMNGLLLRTLRHYCSTFNCCPEDDLKTHLQNIEHWRFVVRLMNEREVRKRCDRASDWHPQSGPLRRGFHWVVELWHPVAKREPHFPLSSVPLPALFVLWDASRPAVDEQSSTATFPSPTAVLRWDADTMVEWVLRPIDTAHPPGD